MWSDIFWNSVLQLSLHFMRFKDTFCTCISLVAIFYFLHWAEFQKASPMLLLVYLDTEPDRIRTEIKSAQTFLRSNKTKGMRKLIMQARSRTWWHGIHWLYVCTSITFLSSSWNKAEKRFSPWFNAQAILHSGLLGLCSLLHFCVLPYTSGSKRVVE